MFTDRKRNIIDNKIRRILIAEDEFINRELLSNILKNDFEIITAENDQQALDIIMESCNSLSLVLLDLNMPKLSGQEILKTLKKSQNTKICL